MSSGIYSIGITGMNAAQLGLVTTEHNITNANTAGYNRQRVVQATNIPVATGAGFVGQGTHVETIQRMYSRFLSEQVNRTQTNVSELSTYTAQISQIDNMLADPQAGLTPALQAFFTGVQQVATDPASLPARQAMVSAAEAMMSRVHGLESRLTELATGVNGQISTVVGTINSYARQIANMNERIVVAQSASSQPANDLLDQRDQLLSELNKLVKVTTTQEDNGSTNVFIGSGQQLVVGVQSMELTSTPSESDPERFVVGIKSVGGNVQELPENLVTGGQLGGLIRFRSESLDPAFNQLGRVVASMAITFNAQHALGQDLQGNIAGDPNFVANLFTMTQPRVVANASNNAASSTISASFTTASSAPPLPQLGHNGTNYYTDLTDSDYRLDYDGANFTLTRLNDKKSWTGVDVTAINAQLAADPQGFSLNASGAAFSARDSFLIQPTREASKNIALDARVVSDPRLLAAAAPVRATAALTNAGKMTIAQGAVSRGYDVTGLPLTATVNGAATQLTGLPAGVSATYSDGSVLAPGGNVDLLNGTATLKSISFNGMTFDISGAANAGDSFVIAKNSTASTGVKDSRNIVLLGKLQLQKTVSGGSANYQSSYAQLVSDIGNRTNEAQVTGDAQKSLLEQATSARSELSGVNLDEEAANLIRYQQAYQASAKMLEIGAKLFDTLMSL